MLKRAGSLATLMLIWSMPAIAATDIECLSLWKSADVNSNGALTQDEDKSGYIAAAEKSGRSLVKPGTLSRDEFVQICQENVFADVQSATGVPTTKPMTGPAASRDIGKGDLTPSLTALPEAEARKKLTENGFKDVRELKLDKEGIWRGTVLVNGQQQEVAIDAQGDMIGKPSPASPNPDSAKATNKTGAAAKSAARGDAGPGGLMLWTFILIGNGLALLALSSFTSGGTSAMSSRTSNPFV